MAAQFQNSLGGSGSGGIETRLRSAGEPPSLLRIVCSSDKAVTPMTSPAISRPRVTEHISTMARSDSSNHGISAVNASHAARALAVRKADGAPNPSYS